MKTKNQEIEERILKRLNKIEDDLIAIAPATIMDITIQEKDKEFKQKLKQLKKKPQKVSSFSQNKPDLEKDKLRKKAFDYLDKYGDNHNGSFKKFVVYTAIDKLIQEKDKEFKQKLEQLKHKIAQLPNRDDWLQKDLPIKAGVLDGGGVGRFKVMDLIEKEIKELK